MLRSIYQSQEITCLSILQEDGTLDQTQEPDLTKSQLKKIHATMLLTRRFDERCIKLQRQGKMGTFSPAVGQEAVAVGSAAALEASDWAVPAFREQGLYFFRGIAPKQLLLFFMGCEEGFHTTRELKTLPFAIPCASQILHGVGIGMAIKIQKQNDAVAIYFGDGASSEGDFHEGLNFAAVFQTPTVFLCQNNQWAISTPRKKQTHSETLAQKALAYGMAGRQVDGNDVLAVYAATREALEQARHGQGPTLIECLTYRMLAHTTADDPSRYRSEDETKSWEAKDPIARFQTYLLAKKIFTEAELRELDAQIEHKLQEDIAAAEEFCATLKPEGIFDHVYQEVPAHLKNRWEKFRGKA